VIAVRRITAAVAGLLCVAQAATTPSSAYPRPGVTMLTDVSSTGQEGTPPTPNFCGSCYGVAVSQNGQRVAFSTDAPNLVSGDLNQASDVFVHDFTTGRTERVSVASNGTEGLGSELPSFPNIQSVNPAISANGRYVAFVSWATNLVSGDTNAAPDVFVHDTVTRATTRVSVSSTGAQATVSPTELRGSATDLMVSLSADGRYDAFTSYAANLVADDTNAAADVFVHDNHTGRTWRASVQSGGAQEPCGYNNLSPVISPDGRYVLFTQSGSPCQAVPDLSNPGGLSRMFLHDNVTDQTVPIDPSLSGQPSPAAAYGNFTEPAISADDRYIVFTSSASDIVPTDRNRSEDVFVFDRHTGRTERVSVSSSGAEGQGTYTTWTPYSSYPSISSDGRFVVFYTFAKNFDPSQQDDGKLVSRIFVHDMVTGATELIDRTTDGKQPDCTISPPWAAISATGEYVAWDSCDTNLVAHDTNGTYPDTFWRDRGPVLGRGGTGQAPQASSGTQPLLCIPGVICIPPQGVVSRMAPTGDVAPDLVRRGADIAGLSLAYRQPTSDLFIRESLGSFPLSTSGAVSAPLLYGLDFTANGTRYEIRAQDVPGPSYDEAGGAAFGLFKVTGAGPAQVATQIASLHGGYGTTGQEIVFALPLDVVGLASGGRLTGVRAFTAVGTFAAGPAVVLDRAAL
jgi:Tol biopolymer transport system component